MLDTTLKPVESCQCTCGRVADPIIDASDLQAHDSCFPRSKRKRIVEGIGFATWNLVTAGNRLPFVERADCHVCLFSRRDDLGRIDGVSDARRGEIAAHVDVGRPIWAINLARLSADQHAFFDLWPDAKRGDQRKRRADDRDPQFHDCDPAQGCSQASAPLASRRDRWHRDGVRQANSPACPRYPLWAQASPTPHDARRHVASYAIQ